MIFAFGDLRLAQRLLLHSFLLSCLETELQSPSSAIHEAVHTCTRIPSQSLIQYHLHHMEPGNGTQISEFLLLGFSDKPELQPILFGLFLSMYLITVLGNLLIILAVSSDSHLHTPMYFFLSNLSLVDICFTSTTIPKMLLNIQTQSKAITYAGCFTQLYFFILFAVLDILLLTVMAYDRFVAICHPLHYMVIMNPWLCGLLVLVSWITIVSLFYGTSLGVYLSSASTHSSQSSATASVMYTVVTPMLNPFIYSLRNRDIKGALSSQAVDQPFSGFGPGLHGWLIYCFGPVRGSQPLIPVRTYQRFQVWAPSQGFSCGHPVR
ncbi:putative olfactory receptor 7A2 [Desmodus rotundus]|uniref:putative olfactory receptor 7A2 n=1 Tax=Desmodus rotundus TaxID=9430 RepID=UPI0039E555B6